jgi:hypothetical protein
MPTRPVAVVNCGQLVTLAGPEHARVGTEMRDIRTVVDGAFTIR